MMSSISFPLIHTEGRGTDAQDQYQNIIYLLYLSAMVKKKKTAHLHDEIQSLFPMILVSTGEIDVRV